VWTCSMTASLLLSMKAWMLLAFVDAEVEINISCLGLSNKCLRARCSFKI
jgi:hypothetical protein